MAETGFSPPTRVFEAAGAAACLFTDAWTGVEQFFQAGREILVATGADDIVRHLHQTSSSGARRIGSAMHSRALRDHIYESRAKMVDKILQAARAPDIRSRVVQSAA